MKFTDPRKATQDEKTICPKYVLLTCLRQIYIDQFSKCFSKNVTCKQKWSKSDHIFEFPRPYCLFTRQLLWGYDDD